MTILPRYRCEEFSARALAEQRAASIAVVVPTRNEAATIGSIVDDIVTLRRAGAIDRAIVADASTDQTPALAHAAGAEVIRQDELMAELGPVEGKGDAMWRALSVCTEDIICFVDGDSSDFHSGFVAGLVGAVALRGARFAKATYRRPFADVAGHRPEGGGRVTQLTALPLLRALFPELASFAQPLAGEIAGERRLLSELAFTCGYGVDAGLLIDVWARCGLEQMAEVDLGSRQNRHQPLAALSAMADDVAHAVLARTDVALAGSGPPLRPPLNSIVAGGGYEDSRRSGQ